MNLAINDPELAHGLCANPRDTCTRGAFLDMSRLRGCRMLCLMRLSLHLGGASC
jgi:hypothetical protein